LVPDEKNEKILFVHPPPQKKIAKKYAVSALKYKVFVTMMVTLLNKDYYCFALLDIKEVVDH